MQARFAWKAFAQWQQRRDETSEDKEKKKKMLEFLTGEKFHVKIVLRTLGIDSTQPFEKRSAVLYGVSGSLAYSTPVCLPVGLYLVLLTD